LLNLISKDHSGNSIDTTYCKNFALSAINLPTTPSALQSICHSLDKSTTEIVRQFSLFSNFNAKDRKTRPTAPKWSLNCHLIKAICIDISAIIDTSLGLFECQLASRSTDSAEWAAYFSGPSGIIRIWTLSPSTSLRAEAKHRPIYLNLTQYTADGRKKSAILRAP